VPGEGVRPLTTIPAPQRGIPSAASRSQLFTDTLELSYIHILAVCSHIWTTWVYGNRYTGWNQMSVMMLLVWSVVWTVGGFTFWIRTTSWKNPIIWIANYQLKLVL